MLKQKKTSSDKTGKSSETISPRNNLQEVSKKLVTVVSAGNNPLRLPLAGKKVGDVFKQLRASLNAAKNSRTLVNGEQVDSNYELKAGETLEFVRFSGEKGS